MGSTALNPITVDDQEDQVNSAPTTTTPECDRPTELQDYWEVVHSGID